MKCKISLFVFLFSLVSCVNSKINYEDFIVQNDFKCEENGIIYGFLREDIEIKTPYGTMRVGPIGFESGYHYDFAVYNNNVPAKIWLTESASVFIDNMQITIPSYYDNEYSYIDFHNNFVIKQCRIMEPVTFDGFNIPRDTALHFDKNGKLECFVVLEDVLFRGKAIKAFTQMNISNGKIQE